MSGNETVLNRFMTPTPRNSSKPAVERSDRLPASSIRGTVRHSTIDSRERAEDRQSGRRVVASFPGSVHGDLLRGFSGIDGRKTVLLFSEGFYGNNVGRELEDVARAAAETYSVIYALDLNKRLDLVTANTTAADDPIEIDNRLVPLGNLAIETSGLLLKDASVRLDAVFKTLLPEESYYLLGFEPGPDAAETDYRRVKVNVTRQGARAVSRTGYALGGTHARDAPARNRRRAGSAIHATGPQD